MGDEHVRVVVRVRPLNNSEKTDGYRSIIHVNLIDRTISIESPGRETTGSRELPVEAPPKIFTFDTVFAPDVKQVDVYNRVARNIVNNVLEGYNGTIFAYGQTGTGKTFTMEGDRNVNELKGIIPNSFAHIFGHIAKSEEDKIFLVRVSYLEIYNEEVRDLLGKDQNTRLDVKERPDVGVYVKDLSAFVVNNADDMDKLMTIGNKNRSVGPTNMNAHSSRSHAIFTITIECSEKAKDNCKHFRVGKLHLVDLAGSERQGKTGATGVRLKEATKINLSLSTLGNVISALIDGKCTHVPYRNSKLTRLLQDSLGGNSKTLMFANIGPADYNYDETLGTLRYASRAKSIKNQAKINEDPKDALMKQYQKEIEDLKKMLVQEGDEKLESETEGEETDDDDDQTAIENEVAPSKDTITGDKDLQGDGDKDNTTEKKIIKITKKVKKKKKKERVEKESKSNAEILEMKSKIEAEKKRLEEEKDMAEEQRNQLAKTLKIHEEELSAAQNEQATIRQKLDALEKKIIVGGENLLEKSEEQERLLEESAKELDETIVKEQDLRDQLLAKEAERVDIEEKYSSLQDEANGKTRKLKKVWSMLQTAKGELTDLQTEQQREMEGLLDSVRHLTRELRLQMLIIDSFIPREYLDIIDSNVAWNEDIGEWQLRCVAYTGNNMRKSSDLNTDRDEGGDLDLSAAYLRYSDGQPKSRADRVKSARPKSSKLRRRK